MRKKRRRRRPILYTLLYSFCFHHPNSPTPSLPPEDGLSRYKRVFFQQQKEKECCVSSDLSLFFKTRRAR